MLFVVFAPTKAGAAAAEKFSRACMWQCSFADAVFADGSCPPWLPADPAGKHAVVASHEAAEFDVDGTRVLVVAPSSTADGPVDVTVLQCPPGTQLRDADGAAAPHVVWSADGDDVGGALAQAQTWAASTVREKSLRGQGLLFVSDNVRRLAPSWRTSHWLDDGGCDGVRCQIGDVVCGIVSCDRPFALRTPGNDLVQFAAGARVRTVAPVGVRQSGTHVNGAVPAGGLLVRAGTQLSWLAADSGLVGNLEGNATSANKLAEGVMQFTALGAIRGGGGGADDLLLSTMQLAVPHNATEVTAPILVVSATSAEAGKTTLTCKIISYLSQVKGLRVASIKATGTGGRLDMAEHAAAGAVVSYDQVDSGMPTTYIAGGEYAAKAERSFLAAQDAVPDVIVVELGGDIIWANNATLLRQPFLRRALRALYVIANDSLSAFGTLTWLRGLDEEGGSAPALSEVASYVCSPFRNHAGAVKRAAVLGMAPPLHADDVEGIVATALPRLSPGA
jgi:hypothetical protein